MRPNGEVLRLLFGLTRRSAPRSAPSDAVLLKRFLADKNEQAFKTLLERHGPMVFGVCRGILRNDHDAEEAFQAAFLVLALKAKGIRNRDSLAGWLYGVANRKARQLRRGNHRRWQRERKLRHPDRSESVNARWPESRLQADLIHEGLRRLPTVYRTAIVLCDLQERSRAEAASELGMTQKALNVRLSRARAKLKEALIQRGVTGPTIRSSVLAPGVLLAKVPDALASSTCTAVTGLLSGANLASLVSVRVAELVQEGFWHGARGKLIATFVGLMLAGGGTVFGFTANREAQPPSPTHSPHTAAVNPDAPKDDPKKAEAELQALRQKRLDDVCVPTLIKELESLSGKAEKIKAEAGPELALVQVRWTHALQGRNGPWTVQIEHRYRVSHEVGVFYGDDQVHYVNPEQPIYWQPIRDGKKFVFGKTQAANIRGAFVGELDSE